MLSWPGHKKIDEVLTCLKDNVIPQNENKWNWIYIINIGEKLWGINMYLKRPVGITAYLRHPVYSQQHCLYIKIYHSGNVPVNFLKKIGTILIGRILLVAIRRYFMILYKNYSNIIFILFVLVKNGIWLVKVVKGLIKAPFLYR